ncbi:hypothetical protein PVAND_015605 [Polypedilum vanderplanki]|uniref:Globin domain-containing protein n=1 Tax=Polypedilum vanderplanki TaxID=319348 RepID=A0A9J6BDC9_POLVA|nr:hypothetical protein PVAND_015605 [Polypedilum vanderplanki]
MKFLILALCVAAVAADPHWLMLPANEVAAVKDTWNHIKHDEVAILEAVFKAYPDIQARFPNLPARASTQSKDQLISLFTLHASSHSSQNTFHSWS